MQLSNADRSGVGQGSRAAQANHGRRQFDHDHRRRILIIEDEALVALDVCEQAEALGFDVCGIVRTLGDAVSLAEQAAPDLAVVDVSLGGEEDGIEIAAALKQRFGINIVFLTAHTDQTTRERIEAIEPLAYLFKPYATDLLRHALLGD